MLSHSCMPFTPSLMSLSFHAVKSSVTFMGKLVCFAFVGILIICGRDVKQGHTALWHICLIGRVQDIILTSTGLISREDFNTSNRCCSRVDRSCACTGFGSSWGPTLGPTATARPGTRSRWTRWAWMTLSWSMLRCRTLARRRRSCRLWALQRRGLGPSALGWRAYCRGRSGGKTTQRECFGISLNLCGCCGGRGRRTCPHCSGCTTSCTADDSLLQNILGLPVAVERWSVCKIQAVKP